jgi:hypothetical protein
MKNIYIIATRENGQEPILIKQKSREDLTYLGNYKNAYFAESKEQAEQTREKRYRQREERKTDPVYKNTYF